jgi:hypothetical protein
MVLLSERFFGDIPQGEMKLHALGFSVRNSVRNIILTFFITDFHSDNHSIIRRPFPARIVFLFLSMIADYSGVSMALQKVSVSVFSF